MKICITGTKGIPNQYGGFEQFVQHISQGLASKGHDVYVYNPTFHPGRDNIINKVKIIRKLSPEKIIGGAANYLYDYLCIKDAIAKGADIILECGYASAAPACRLLDFKKTKIITHLDGFEWQRTKWSRFVRSIILRSERSAVQYSDELVCDHPLIKDYYRKRYAVDPVCIPYGADINIIPDSSMLKPFPVKQGEYFLIIARLERENNIHTIIEGFKKSGIREKLLIIGNTKNPYSIRLKKMSGSFEQAVFVEAIYNESLLHTLRYFCKAYFHGHSVGGTNPSLLEAMAAGAMIIAHDNPFNRYVLKGNALFFQSSGDISRLKS